MEIVLLDSVRVDANTQVRARIDEAVVEAYAEAMRGGAVFPPVVLFHDGNQHYLADGFHRTLATQRVGFTTISAEVRKGTQQDALWFALGANTLHGKQLTKDDKRHAIILALRTWPDKSQNEIAKQIGCAQSWISSVKAQVIGTDSLPAAPSRVTGKDGKSYPASRPTHLTVETPLPDLRGKGGKRLPEATIRSIEVARRMAEDGHTSRQIAAEIGVKNADHLSQRLKAHGIVVRADKFAKANRHDPNRIVASIVSEVDGSASAIALVNLATADASQFSEWAASLTKSIRALSAFVRQMKTMNGETASV